MLFTTLINTISTNTNAKILHSADIHNIEDVALIDGVCAQYLDNTLYFGYFEQLSGGLLPAHCVLVRTESVKQLTNIQTDVCLADASELFALFNAAKSCIDRLRSQGFYGELLDCAARSSGIQPVINLAAAKLNNSVILLDCNFKVLAASTVFPIDDPLWAQNIQQGYCTYEFVQAVQQLDSVKNAQRNSDPVVVTCFASPLRKLSSKMFIDGNYVGIILMLERETPISAAHMQLLPIISAASSEAIRRYTPYLLPGNTVYQKLLYDLLIGAPPETIAPQLTGLHFSSHLCALCLRPNRYVGQQHLQETVSMRLTNSIPNLRFTIHENNIAALLSLEDSPTISSEHLECLRTLAEQEHMYIGISHTFFRPESFAQYYAQAQKALELNERLSNTSPICLYSDVSFYDLLDHSQNCETLGVFCHPALTILNRYDAKNNSDLYHTLDIFLACGCSVKNTAQALFIHRNSLNYRLERIHTLTQINLNDSNLCFLLRMSFAIDRYLGNTD